MKELLAQLQAVKMLALDWHYTASGPSFYAQHLLADKVTEDLPLDDLVETYYLGEKRKTPPKQAEIMADAIKLAEKNNGSPALNVRELLKLASAHAEELARGNVSIGTKSLLDAVSQKCYVGIGLIERTVTE